MITDNPILIKVPIGIPGVVTMVVYIQTAVYLISGSIYYPWVAVAPMIMAAPTMLQVWVLTRQRQLLTEPTLFTLCPLRNILMQELHPYRQQQTCMAVQRQ